VTQLTVVEDFADKASKYCLRTQEQDSEGEIETRLYKADVLTTVGGGAQVVFNDVEVLRQESPTAAKSPAGGIRKRPSSSGLLSGLVTSSPFRSSTRVDDPEVDIAKRCRTGISSTTSVLNSERNRPT